MKNSDTPTGENGKMKVTKENIKDVIEEWFAKDSNYVININFINFNVSEEELQKATQEHGNGKNFGEQIENVQGGRKEIISTELNRDNGKRVSKAGRPGKGSKQGEAYKKASRKAEEESRKREESAKKIELGKKQTNNSRYRGDR